MADRSVYVRLSVRPEGAVAGFRTAQTAARDFNREIAKSEQKRKALRDVGTAAGVVGLAFTGIGVAAVGASAKFDRAMSSVQAATHETRANMELLRHAAIKAGADTSFSATEAANGIEELAKAGVSTRDILAGGLKGALDLAAAGSIGVAEAAETTASTMNQFNLKGADTVHIADVLSATAGKAQGSVSDMGLAFKYVGPVAAQMGVSLEETAGAVGLLASRGILADQAGTSLRGMLSSLTSPSKVASDTMKQYGISVYDTAGQFVGFEGVAGQLQKRLGTLGNAERDAALGRLFGNEQITAARILYDGGASSIDKWTRKVNDQGYAAETAALKMDNLSGDLERLRGSLETALIGTGQGAQGPLRSLAQTGDQLVDTYNALPGPLKSTALGLAGVTAAVGGATFVTTRAVTGVHSMNETLQTLGLRSKKAGGEVAGFNKRALAVRGGALAVGAGLTALSGKADDVNHGLGVMTSAAGAAAMGFSVAGPWGAAIGGGIGLLTSFADGNAEAAKDVSALAATLDVQTGAVTQNTGAWIAADLRKSGTIKAARDIGISLDTLTRAAMGSAPAIQAVNAAVRAANKEKPEFYGGEQVEMSEGAKAAQKVADAVGGLSGKVKSSKKEWQENKTVTEAVTGSQKNAKGAISGTSAAVGQQVARLEALKKAQDDARDSTLNTYESQTSLRRAYRDAAEAANTNRNGIKRGGEAAIAARESIATLARAWNNASDEAQDKPGAYRKARRNFIQLAESMGYSREQARALAKRMLEIPKKRTAKVDADTKNASRKVSEWTTETKRQLNSIGPFDVDINLSAQARSTIAASGSLMKGATGNANVFGAKDKLATGGQVIGPGSGTSDDIPVYLSNGEHVFTAAEVKKAGGQSEIYRLRQAIMSGEFKKRGDLGYPGKGSRPAFAKGGAVGTINVESSGLAAAVASVTADFNSMAVNITAELSRVVNDLFKVLGAGVGGLSPVEIARGQAFARSQVGKPYVWGGVGPGGYDCSGFVSAVLNAALGMNPYSRRGATGSMPWAGFRSGGGGAFDVGWFTGSPGHTAARIGNMNVESYGGHGPAVGSGARGPGDGLFNRRMSYAGKRDGGGLFPSGSFVANTSGRTEYVLDPRATQHLASGGAVTKSASLSTRAQANSLAGLTWALQQNTAAVARNTTAVTPSQKLVAANRRKAQFDAATTTYDNALSAYQDAASNRASRLDLLNQQKSIRDLEKSLKETEKVGKKGNKRTQLVLRKGSLDREIAQAELGEAKRELARMQASAAALTRARAALEVAKRNRGKYGSAAAEEQRVAAAEAAVEAAEARAAAAQERAEAVSASSEQVTSGAGIGDAGSASAVNRNLTRTLANLASFTQVMGDLKRKGAPPWLLAQLNEAGPTRAAIRIGRQYLNSPALLSEVGQKAALLASLGSSYGSMTNDPRWMQAGAASFNVTQAVQKQIDINVRTMSDGYLASEVARLVDFRMRQLVVVA